MKESTIEVRIRTDQGSGAAGRWRRQGFIPSVLCSRGQQSVKLLLGRREFEYLARQSRLTTLFRFKSQDQELNNKRALVQEIQQNYLTGDPLHVDFREVRENERVRLSVPLNIVGEPYGVKNEGGVLTVATHNLEVFSLPDNIPDTITVEVSDLHLNQSVKAGDLKLPEGVTLKTSAAEAIASVTLVREVVETAAAEAAPVEGAAGTEAAAAAAPVEGAAPAADEAAKKAEPAKKEGGKKGE